MLLDRPKRGDSSASLLYFTDLHPRIRSQKEELGKCDRHGLEACRREIESRSMAALRCLAVIGRLLLALCRRACLALGSALVPSAGFGVPPKRTLKNSRAEKACSVVERVGKVRDGETPSPAPEPSGARQPAEGSPKGRRGSAEQTGALPRVPLPRFMPSHHFTNDRPLRLRAQTHSLHR